MERVKKEKDFFSKEILYKFVILLVSVFCIVYILPRNSKNSLQIEEGMPWPHSQIMAEFDFPIYKSDAALQQEQDSIMADFAPYCQLSDSIVPDLIKKVHEQLQKSPEISSYQRSLIIQKLREVYKTGVLEGDEYANLQEDNIKQIMVYSHNTAYRVPLPSVYTTKKAYEILMQTDSVHLNRAALQKCNLDEILQPNLTYDTNRSEKVREEMLSSISQTAGMVVAGTKIIDRGEIVNAKTYNILVSWKKETERRTSNNNQGQWLLLGQLLFVTTIITIFLLYLTLFRKDYFEDPLKIILIFSLIVIYPVLTAFFIRYSWFNVYIIPYAMAPMMIRVIMDSRTAFMSFICIILLCSLTLKYPYQFVLIETVAGAVSIMSLRELSQRSQLIKAAFIITSVSIAFYFSYEMIHENDLSKIDTDMYKYLCINGVLLLFTYPLLYLVERAFKFTTDVTYVELSNINAPLLQKMSEVAPGTFQHCMQVANLAAEVSRKIGAKTQLVRTGALYHDVGKMNNPAFFTENQAAGINPHAAFDEKQSAQIIVNHVLDGIKLAEKHSIPQDIKNFIVTHHGASVTKYFFIKYKNEHPDEDVDITPFQYPGPNPFEKEHAIVMMADSVEAASRSLPDYTEETISNLVEKIIDQQVADGCFKNCPITFKDILVAKEVFKEKLKIIYHTRIAYPELKK